MTSTNEKKKIMVVEDESIIATDIQASLIHLGYNVPVIATSGKGAIKYAQEIQPDLVLMDIALKGSMSGTEAAAEIHHRWHTPIVFLTAYADSATLEKAKQAEPFGYIAKPFNETELRVTVEMALHKAKMEAERRGFTDKIQKKHREIIEDSVDSISSLTIKGRYTYVNRAFSKEVGKAVEEVIGKGIGDIFPKDEADKKLEALDTVVRTGEEKAIEGMVSRRSGARYQETTISPIKGNSGEVLSVVCCSKDITEYKRIQDELRASRHFRQCLLERTPNLIYVYDMLNNSIIYVNQEVVNYLGFTPEQIQAMGASFFAKLLHPDDSAAVNQHLARFISASDQNVIEIIYRMKHSDGRWIWLRSQDVAFKRNDEGTVTQILGTAEDITAQKRDIEKNNS